MEGAMERVQFDQKDDVILLLLKEIEGIKERLDRIEKVSVKVTHEGTK